LSTVAKDVLYFSLKSLDLVTMKKLDTKVNIIPVIAKSDTITKAELLKFKQKVRHETDPDLSSDKLHQHMLKLSELLLSIVIN